MKTDYSFPAYRKYVGVDTWFKITGERHFVEVKQLGNRYLVSEIQASQFPEIQLIRDMLACFEDRWEVVPAEAFDRIYALAR